ncbi:sensor histidine kinase [Eudoraea chungangensis]|uniref:sensor histidine kinase n=1 Tax=Eudoraea chungangensis TaxID=1481905 RepID=UPI0023ED8A61|nr:sensor histidine kinase [Eudoraea chungangensis]
MNRSKSKWVDTLLQSRWQSHILFWVLGWILQALVSGTPYGSYSRTFIHTGIMLLPQVLASYLLVYYQVPHLLFKRKYLLFGLSFLISAYFFSALARIMVVHIIEEIYRTPPFRQEPVWEILTDLRELVRPNFFRVYSVAFTMLIIKLLKENFEEKSKRELLEKKKITAELKFFKAQIHPHFMFNTLNNLYVLTLKKSDKAPEMLLKLSEILDYMLYQCNDQFVSIEKEAKLIQNYIDLEKLRYGSRLSLTLKEEIDNSKTQIAPLILISLIENAFKHGASGSLVDPVIEIELTVKDNILLFSIFNTKNKLTQEDQNNHKEGIGLSNTRSQLQLIYPDKHYLEIDEKDESYMATLKIDMNK